MKGIDSHTPPCARAMDVGATIESTYGAGLGMTLAARSVLAASQRMPVSPNVENARRMEQ